MARAFFLVENELSDGVISTQDLSHAVDVHESLEPLGRHNDGCNRGDVSSPASGNRSSRGRVHPWTGSRLRLSQGHLVRMPDCVNRMDRFIAPKTWPPAIRTVSIAPESG